MTGYEVYEIPSQAQLLRSEQYPRKLSDVPDGVIVTQLGIYKVKAIGGYFSLSYWMSFIYGVPDDTYQVILRQTKTVQDEKVTDQAFLLFESASTEESKIAFETLQHTIMPLFESGTLLLTKALLTELILNQELLDPAVLTDSLQLFELLDYDPESEKTRFTALSESEGFLDSDAINEMPKDAPDENGLIPLMIATQNNKVEEVIKKLKEGENPNYRHPQSGNTALHLAAAKGNPRIVKAIVAFMPKLLVKNMAGRTPLEEAEFHSTGSKKWNDCIEILRTTADLFKDAKDKLEAKESVEHLDETDTPTLQPGSIVLLSLDGGGIRALITCQILIAIYQRMKYHRPDCGPFHQHFDYIAGTSIGGILALAMVYANMSLEDTVKNLFKLAKDVLSKCPNAPKGLVDRYAKELAGDENKELKDVPKPRVIITTSYVVSKNELELKLLCNYKETHGRSWKVWEAGRATSAAPMYFPPLKIQTEEENEKTDAYIDGGLTANNPTFDALQEISKQLKEENENTNVGMVLSIGTGKPIPSRPATQVNVLSHKKWQNYFRPLKLLRGIMTALGWLESEATQSDGRQLGYAENWCDDHGAHYYRFSTPELPTAIDLAEHRGEKLANMMYFNMHFILKNIEKIDEVAQCLLSRQIED